MWKRHTYNLNGAVFFGDDVLLEVYSDRPRPELSIMLEKKGITVSGRRWYPKNVNGVVLFSIVYHIQRCRYCPHGERNLFMMDTHRIIDEINASIF